MNPNDMITGEMREKYSCDAVRIKDEDIAAGDIDLTIMFEGRKFARRIFSASGGTLIVMMLGRNAKVTPVPFILQKGGGELPSDCTYTRIISKGTTCSGIVVLE